MNLINLTPHPVNLLNEQDETILTLPGHPNPPRLKQSDVVTGHFQVFEEQTSTVISVPLSSTQFGEIQNLPDEVKGTLLIVSRLVMTACPDRDDLIVPNQPVRDEKGRIVGCRSFAMI